MRSRLILFLLNRSPHAAQPLTLGGSGMLWRAQRAWDGCRTLPLHQTNNLPHPGQGSQCRVTLNSHLPGS